MAGSNSCVSGFRTPAEAREFRDAAALGDDWRLVDLREERPRHTRSSLEAARREMIEQIFESTDFGDREVAAFNGWDYDGAHGFSRVVFLENGSGDSIRTGIEIQFVEHTAEDWVVHGPGLDDLDEEPDEPGM
jgi:hypothetical protein